MNKKEKQKLGTAEQLLEEECKDGDRICKALGVERTAGGRMNIRGLLNAIKRRQHGKGEGCWCIPTEVGNGIFEHRQAITYWVIEKETSPVQYLSWGAKWFWSDDFSLANRWDEKHDAEPYIETHGGVVREHMDMVTPNDTKGSASTLRLSVRMLREDIDELQRKLAEYEDAPVVGHVADDGYFVAEHRNVWRHIDLIYKPGVVKPAKEGTKT